MRRLSIVNLLGIGSAMVFSTCAYASVAVMHSDAALALKAGNYQSAVQGFSALQKQHPDNLTIQRYLGISLDRAGRSKPLHGDAGSRSQGDR